MHPCGARADEQLLADLPVGRPLSHESQDGDPAIGQLGDGAQERRLRLPDDVLWARGPWA